MTVALIDSGVSGEEVEVTAPLRIEKPRARCTLDDYVEWMIVMRAITVFNGN
jgi:hypothetical protein